MRTYVLIFTLGIIGLLGASACTIAAELLVYGIADQKQGAAVSVYIGGTLKQTIMANDLRPSSVKEDWTRHLFPLQPLAVMREQVFYYLPESPKWNLRSGIYRKSFQSDRDVELFLRTPELISISKGTGAEEFYIVTASGELLSLNLRKSPATRTLASRVSFASWDSARSLVVAVDQPRTTVSLIDIQRRDPKTYTRVFRGTNVKRAFAIAEDGCFAIEATWGIGIYTEAGKKVAELAKDAVTASAYDAAMKTLFYFVANDNDGRTLYSWSRRQTYPERLLSGVFNDTLIVQ